MTYSVLNLEPKENKMKSRLLIISLLIVTVFSVLVGCGEKPQSEKKSTHDQKTVETVAQKELITVKDGSLELAYYGNEVDLGTLFRVDCKSDIKLTDCKLTTGGTRAFKVYIHESYYEMITRNEGKENFKVAAPDGSTVEFSLDCVVQKQPLSNMKSYCKSAPYLSEATENQLGVRSIKDDTVSFGIQRGEKNKLLTADGTAKLHDGNKADFEITDSSGNKYKGSMEFDMYTIYLKIELTEEKDTSRGTLECDCRMLPSA